MSKPPIHLEGRVEQGRRICSPSAGRNQAVIGDVLEKHLPPIAHVLEIASGTGEHAVHNCRRRPDITWQPTDPDERSRQSQDAWRAECPDQMLVSVDVDTIKTGWWQDFDPYHAIFCANMIHIAPWDAALGLAQGAGHLIRPGGQVFLYGPFKEGDETAESNLNFDTSLKNRNSAWGVRELESVKHIFADAGFNLSARIVMPKENRTLIFSKMS